MCGKQRIGRLVVPGVLFLAACACAAAEKASLSIEYAADGALTVRLGDKTLLANSKPEIESLVPLDIANNQEEKAEFAWVREATQKFDAATRTFSAEHKWGGFSVQYQNDADQLTITVKAKNSTDKRLRRFRFFVTGPFTFPKRPKGAEERMTWGGPHSLVADYGEGAVALSLPDEPPFNNAIFAGWTGGQRRLLFQLGGLNPQEERSVKLSLRFAPGSDAGGDPEGLLADYFQAIAKTLPRTVPPWPDRRPIAALHPSSSHLGAGTTGESKNPRGWCMADKIDVATEEGRKRFKEQALAYAKRCVEIAKSMNAQGMICWCLEGQEIPHAISYIGSPDRLKEVALEMDEVADEWFKVFSDAGLRTGVTLRPQKLEPDPGYDPKQPPNKAPFRYRQRELRVYGKDGKIEKLVDEPAVIELLDAKLTYANKRWGCTLFYVDSNVHGEWAQDPKTKQWKEVRSERHSYRVYETLVKKHPDCLIIPEHEDFTYWSCVSPLATNVSEPTSKSVLRVWSEAFSVNLMQGFKPKDPAQIAACEECIRRGDILLFPGWYASEEGKALKAAYERNHNPKWHSR